MGSQSPGISSSLRVWTQFVEWTPGKVCLVIFRLIFAKLARFQVQSAMFRLLFTFVMILGTRNDEAWAEKSFILMWFSIPSFACWSQLIILKWSYLYHLFFTQIHIIAHLNTGLGKISLPPLIPFQKHKILRCKICKVQNKSCQDKR